MGNKASTVSIRLDDEKNVAVAGTRLSGMVVLKVGKRLNGAKLALRLSGKERVTVVHGRNNRKDRAIRSFFGVDLPLKEFRRYKRIKSGNYTFPFSILLPTALPSSSGNEKGFKIEYKMAAEIGGLRVERDLWVSSAPLSGERVTTTVEPTSFEVKAGKIFNRGNLWLAANALDAHVGRGENLDLSIACRNDSATQIQRLEVKLIEEMTWRIGASPDSPSQVERVVLHRFHDLSLPGIDKERKGRAEIRQNKSNRSLMADTFGAMYDDLVSGANRVIIPVPVNSRDTYRGKLVDVVHFVEVRAVTPMLVNNPATKIPIRIGCPPVRRRPEQSLMTDAAAATAVPVVPEAEFTIDPPRPPPFAPQAEVPLVSVVSIPADAIQAPVVTAEADVIVLGGDAIILDDIEHFDPATVPPPVNPDFQAEVPSVESLLRQMASSINDYDIISNRLRNSEWVAIFRSISPDQYGSIIAHIHNRFDQPRVASLLAPHMNNADSFLCIFAAAAVKNCSEWNKASMARTLLPLCSDVVGGHNLIREELNDWDKTVTARDFEDAIAAVIRT